MILAFDAYRRQNRPRLFGCVLSHLVAALMLPNGLIASQGCVYSLLLLALNMIASGLWGLFIVTRPRYRSKKRGYSMVEVQHMQ